MKSKVLVILGPTATGKTDLALSLAKKYSGELVACDSRQVYKGLDIGTGKLPGKEVRFKIYDLRWEVDGVNIWLYDVYEPQNQFSVKDYVDKARIVIKDILDRGKLPIVVGGTGFYLRGLLEGIPNLDIPSSSSGREELEKLSLEELQDKLKQLSPKRWEVLNNSDQHNPRRLLRSIELSMNPYMHSQDMKDNLNDKYEILKIGLTAPNEVLKKKILARLDSRIDQGMIEEAHALRTQGLTLQRMRQLGLEYRYLADLIDEQLTLEKFKEILGTKIYQYAKRQLTWFKHQEKELFWFDITGQNFLFDIEKRVNNWYYSGTN